MVIIPEAETTRVDLPKTSAILPVIASRQDPAKVGEALGRMSFGRIPVEIRAVRGILSILIIIINENDWRQQWVRATTIPSAQSLIEATDFILLTLARSTCVTAIQV